MEEEVLFGALNLIIESKPIMFIEVIKSNTENINKFLNNLDYTIFPMGLNLLAVHNNDSCLPHLELKNGQFSLNRLLGTVNDG